MTVLIPSYEPNSRLLSLINKIKKLCNFKIIVVDDGSGNAYSSIFRSVKEHGCTVLTHNVKKSMPKYFMLVIVVLSLNYGLMYFFYEIIGILLFFAKLLTETIIYLFSYWSQKKFVFKTRCSN